MAQDPYAPPAADLDGDHSPGGKAPLYARIGVRIRAVTIDYLIMLGVLALVAVVGTLLHDLPGASPVVFVIGALFAIFYEPVMVWRTGGTLGHHFKNICVVSEKTGGHPGIVAALVRSLVKAFLGTLSLLFMLSSDRQQALHDMIAGVTVRIKDESLASRRDYVRGGRQ
jgi:uncharacterized RDD family membrane protein YckC